MANASANFGEADANLDKLAANTAHPGLKRCLAGNTGREARRIAKHAHRAPFADQEVNLFAFSCERFRDQALMDEASGALDDIVH